MYMYLNIYIYIISELPAHTSNAANQVYKTEQEKYSVICLAHIVFYDSNLTEDKERLLNAKGA